MYLIYGESFRLIDEEIEKIAKDETNRVVLDLAVLTLQDVLTEATYVSMFNDKKIVIVKNADFFASKSITEEELDSFFAYMENPVKETILIFTTYEKIDMRKKVTKNFSQKYKIIAVGNFQKNDLMTKVRDYVFQNKFKIDTDALEYIINCCGSHYDLIYNELQKLFLYYQEPTTIHLEEVRKITSKVIQDNNFKFVEAVVLKDMKKALNILDDLYTLKIDPIALILLLAREYRLMYSTKFLMERGYPKKSICKELALQDWQIDKLIRNSSSYYLEDLSEYIKKLANIDYKIKSGNADKFLELKQFLLEVI